jgi:hypothetical protein
MLNSYRKNPCRAWRWVMQFQQDTLYGYVLRVNDQVLSNVARCQSLKVQLPLGSFSFRSHVATFRDGSIFYVWANLGVLTKWWFISLCPDCIVRKSYRVTSPGNRSFIHACIRVPDKLYHFRLKHVFQNCDSRTHRVCHRSQFPWKDWCVILFCRQHYQEMVQQKQDSVAVTAWCICVSENSLNTSKLVFSLSAGFLRSTALMNQFLSKLLPCVTEVCTGLGLVAQTMFGAWPGSSLVQMIATKLYLQHLRFFGPCFIPQRRVDTGEILRCRPMRTYTIYNTCSCNYDAAPPFFQFQSCASNFIPTFTFNRKQTFYNIS